MESANWLIHRNDRRRDFVGEQQGGRRAILFVRLNQREQRHRLRNLSWRHRQHRWKIDQRRKCSLAGDAQEII
jgi:hypothetical protein